MNETSAAPTPSRRQQALGAAVLLLTTLSAHWTVRSGAAPPPGVVSAPPAAPGASAGAPESEPAAEIGVAEIEAHVREVARRYGVSPRLVAAIIEAESEFNPRAVSPKGARGLMQLMPATASSLDVEDVHDPFENVEAGVRHLRRLLDRFNGDLALALAAYNAGEQAVVAYGGVPPYPETRRYVSRILRRIGRRDLLEALRPRPPVITAGAPATVLRTGAALRPVAADLVAAVPDPPPTGGPAPVAAEPPPLASSRPPLETPRRGGTGEPRPWRDRLEWPTEVPQSP